METGWYTKEGVGGLVQYPKGWYFYPKDKSDAERRGPFRSAAAAAAAAETRENPVRARWRIVRDMVDKTELDAFEADRDQMILELHEGFLDGARRIAQEVHEQLVQKKLWPAAFPIEDQDILVSWILAMPHALYAGLREHGAEQPVLERLLEQARKRFSQNVAAALAGPRGLAIADSIWRVTAERAAGYFKTNIEIAGKALGEKYPGIAKTMVKAGMAPLQFIEDFRDLLLEFFPTEIP